MTVNQQSINDNINDKDEKFFDSLYDKYYKALVIFAYKYVHDIDIARDIVQELFVDLYEKREQIILVEKTVNSYFYRAVHNRCLNHLKRDKHRDDYKDVTLNYAIISHDDTFQNIVAAELESRIHKAISELPEKCRNVFKLSRFKGAKNNEIAEELNISIKTVENQIANALKSLRNKLSDYFENDKNSSLFI